MPVPILPALLANAVAASAPFANQSPLDGMTSALLTVLAPVWPALEPWLIVGGMVVAMGIATEMVVRELHRISGAGGGGGGR